MPQDVDKIFEDLFQRAKARDEFAYVFALLGINSGIEDAGWQPIGETWQLAQDLLSFARTPVHPQTQMRLLLLVYCQLTEANYFYHIIYNMLTAIEGKTPPKVFNFLDLYKNGMPPSVRAKLEVICDKAASLGLTDLKELLESVFDAAIRNAVSHADFILYNDELRLKHKGTEIRKLKFKDIGELVDRTLETFQRCFAVLDRHKRAYSDGHVISGRKTKTGHDLASINLKVDEKRGLVGFSSSDPGPWWDIESATGQ